MEKKGIFLKKLVVKLMLLGVFIPAMGQYTGVTSGDLDALQAIYDNWIWDHKSDWFAGNTNVADWPGITVSNNRVIGLNLNNENLDDNGNGFIDEVFDLTALQILNLSGNSDFYGTIPSSISNVKGSLMDLYLQNCNLSGVVPGEVGELTELVNLNLSRNAFTGDIPDLQNLKKLEEFRFSHNRAEGWKLVHDFEEMPALKTIYTWYANSEPLEGKAPSFKGSNNIEEITLSGSDFTGGLPTDGYENLKKLKIINFAGCDLTGDFPEDIIYLEKIEKIYLSRNKFDESDFPPGISGLTTLKVLDLASCNLKGTVPVSFWENLIILEYLYLSYNRNLAGYIPNTLNMPELERIYLRSTSFDDVLPPVFFERLTLTHVDFGNTEINADIADFDQLVNLGLLSIDNDTNISGTIPSSINNLTKLRNLNISRTSISEPIPRELADIKTLRVLYLYGLNLYYIPDELSNLENLLYFGFSDNNLTFEDIYPFSSSTFHYFRYNPQNDFALPDETVNVPEGDELRYDCGIDQSIDNDYGTNHYKWQKWDGSAFVDIPGQTTRELVITSMASTDEGRYRAVVTNDVLDELTLYSEPLEVTLSPQQCTIEVTNTQDYADGEAPIPGSFRDAIEQINAGVNCSETPEIIFNIPSSEGPLPYTINLVRKITISSPVIMNGNTQPGDVEDGEKKIIIDWSSLIFFVRSGSTIKNILFEGRGTIEQTNNCFIDSCVLNDGVQIEESEHIVLTNNVIYSNNPVYIQNSEYCTIGGIGNENTIKGNYYWGCNLILLLQNSNYIFISENKYELNLIFGDFAPIQLDNNCNDNISSPSITSASSISISEVDAEVTSARQGVVELYLVRMYPDNTKHYTFLNSQSNASSGSNYVCQFNLSGLSLQPGDKVAATITDTDNNTSEFCTPRDITYTSNLQLIVDQGPIYVFQHHELITEFTASDPDALANISVRADGTPFTDYNPDDAILVTDGSENSITGHISWYPPQLSVGQHEVIITARSGLEELSVTRHIIVLETTEVSFNTSCDNTHAEFYAGSIEGDVNYKWDFGDGSTPQEGINLTHVSHDYESDGNYTVMLTLTKENAETHTSVLVMVGNPDPVFYVKDGCLGYPMAFSAPAGPTQYEWAFGDEDTSYAQSPLHLYKEEGAYDVTLSVVRNGCKASHTQTVTVGMPVNAEIDLPVEDRFACPGSKIQFKPGDDDDGLSYMWDFGDGNKSVREKPRHAFDNPGQYRVKLTASNGMCKDSSAVAVLVESPPGLTIETPEGQTTFCSGESIRLEAVMTSSPTRVPGLEYNYLWKNKDEDIIINQGSKAIHVTESGTYTVELSHNCGVSNPAEATVSVIPVPEANITPISGVTCPGWNDGSAEVEVTNAASGDSYTIRWGDGQEAFWDEGDNPLALNNLSQGTNYITIINDNSGCSSVFTVDIPYDGPELIIETQHATCDNPNAGEVTVNLSVQNNLVSYVTLNETEITSPTMPYTFSNLVAGQYHVSVEQQNGCVLKQNGIGVSQPQVVVSVDNTISCGSGEVNVKAEPALLGANIAPAFEYNWFSLDETGNETALSHATEDPLLAPGTYRLRVTETTTGCQGETDFDVEEGSPLTMNLLTDPPECPGDVVGKATAYANGAVGDYHYIWIDHYANDTISYTAKADTIYTSDSYTVQVFDGRGCMADTTFSIPDAPDLFTLDNLTGGPCIAEVDVSPAPVEETYKYEWIRLQEEDDGNITEVTEQTTYYGIASNLAPGNYIVAVSTESGCTVRSDNQVEVTGRENPVIFNFVYAFKNQDRTIPEPEIIEDIEIVEVVEEMQNEMLEKVNDCKEQMQGTIELGFEETCLNPGTFMDKMEITYNLPYYQYTLYYYDRAGNLTKTVPPEGVDLLDMDEINEIMVMRTGGTNVTEGLPDHRMATKYEYNGLQQLTEQYTPDGGTTHFIYDNKSLLRFSQNAKQDEYGHYAYTKYDHLGRIIESGRHELGDVTDFAGLADFSEDHDYPYSGGEYKNIVVYNDPATGIGYLGDEQEYLVNRVSYSYTDEDGDLSTRHDRSGTYYSYDAHGNVKWLIHDIPGFGKNRIKYDYDLISGNVKQVKLNEYRNDYLVHRYEYDADNRITTVWTSKDGFIWDKDSEYDYYQHGPLKRKQIGEDNIQGIDYTYTIGGWLKALNHPTLNTGYDPGQDDEDDDGCLKDVFGMSLGYFKGDFAKTYGTDKSPFNDINNFADNSTNLYNGNIATWALQVKSSDNTPGTFNDRMTARVFRYDKLNRIKSGKFWEHGTDWAINNTAWNEQSDAYATDYEYDRNGNILSLNRNGYETGNMKMDELTYSYEVGTNRLQNVKDKTAIPNDGEYGDIRGYTGYDYDATGNLVSTWGETKSISGGIYEYKTNIFWNPSGKVDSVYRVQYKEDDKTDTTETRIKYRYDGSGNRVVKQVVNDTADIEANYTNYYVRDASGNIMGIYQRKDSIIENPEAGLDREAWFTAIEQPLYGSDRLGMIKPNTVVYSEKYSSDDPPTDINMKETPPDGSNTYSNWVIPANAPGEQPCDCQLNKGEFTEDAGGSQSFGSNQSMGGFMGYASNNVTVAEDLDGNLQFYSITPEKYFGHKNVCLVYDKECSLMENSDGIISSSEAKPVIIKLPGNNLKYAMITVGPEGKPYYHEIDMSVNGYGTTYMAGKVSIKNRLMDNPADDERYGWHIAALEDHIIGQAIVYMNKYKEPATPADMGEANIMAFEFKEGDNNIPQPETVVTLNSFDKKGEGEMHISEDGQSLIYYNRKKGIAGFAHKEVEVNIMPLSSSRKSIEGQPIAFAGPVGGVYGKSSIEKLDDNILFSQQGIYLEDTDSPVDGGNNTTYHLNATDNTLSQVNDFGKGDLRLGKDGYIHQSEQGATGILNNLNPETNATEINDLHHTAYNTSGALPAQVYRIAPRTGGIFTREIGTKRYELKDHLGNVRAVVSDIKKPTTTTGDIDEWTWTADVTDHFSYYPFGMLEPGRQKQLNTVDAGGYRFGFNGHEKDDEWTGVTGSHLNFGARIYDSRIGRWLSVDPRAHEYPWQTTYAYHRNNLIAWIDYLGGGDPPTVVNGVYFVKLKNPTANIVSNLGMTTFTGRVKGMYDNNKTDDYTVNLQQYGVNSIWSYPAAAARTASVTTGSNPFSLLGQNVQRGEVTGEATDERRGYLAQDENGKWSGGLGNPPENSAVGFGGGIPIIVAGQLYNEESSQGYANQNSTTVGKVIIAFNSKDNSMMLVVSPDELETGGMTLDAIRDRLAGEGYDYVFGFDGGSSSTLIQDSDNELVLPSWYKDNTIPSGVTISGE